MTKLILVRHGESAANFARIFTGQGNFPLTERGLAQAQAAGQYIKNNENISAVYASPLIRAFNTGKAIADACGVEIIPCPGLMEINAGEWEGKNFDDLEVIYKNSYYLWRNDIGHACPDGGESVRDLSERCIKTVEKIVADNTDKILVLATHATPIRVLSAYWQSIAVEDLKNIPWAVNASLTEVCYENNGSFHSFKTNICEHLEGITTALPSNV